jgi:YfiH family protein
VKPHPAWIVPNLSAPGVRALITTRPGGVSRGPWGAADDGGGMNLGLGSGDATHDVLANRARLQASLPQPPRWLKQVHGAAVVDAEQVSGEVAADASTSLTPGVVCAVLVADCLPVVIASADGRGVAVAHAGWRGLAAGVIQNTVQALRRRLGDAHARLSAYLGPAIGPRHFEVGGEVLEAMRSTLPAAARAFVELGGGKFRADLFELARMALTQVGVHAIEGGGECTYSDPLRFYSYRRDGITGRHAALVWIEPRPTDRRV